MREYDVIIVGAGPAGMTACIIAAGAGKSVLIIDKNKKPGRKLYATGNGKCNLSNNYLDLDCYNSQDEYFPYQVITNDTYNRINNFVTELGVPVEAVDGYYYPVSRQASTVVWAFTDAMKAYGAELAMGEKCLNVSICQTKYKVNTDKNTYICKNLILACGGKASPKLGGTDSGLVLCQRLGLTSTYTAPSLCRLFVSENISILNGVRNHASSVLYDGSIFYQKSVGELQFAGDALSGIMIFNLSSLVQDILHKKGKPVILVDTVPDMTEASLEKYLTEYGIKHGTRTVNACLNGLMNDKLAEYICIKHNINKIIMEKIFFDKELIDRLIYDIKHLCFHVTDTGAIDDCQVMKGGIATGQINPINMKVKGSTGLYVIGEMVDVDGICGGYNIMWAIATGIKAGESIIND